MGGKRILGILGSRSIFAIGMMLFCMLCMSGCGDSQTGKKDIEETTSNAVLDKEMGNTFDLYPFNGRIPCIFYDEEIYTWDRISTKYIVVDGNVGYAWTYVKAYLPDNYQKVGALIVTEDMPNQDCQIGVKFDLQGALYANEESPEVIYAFIQSPEISGDGWSEGLYVRFITEEWKREILVEGNTYSGNQIGKADSIPEGFELMGEVVYVGNDCMPQNNLETNILNFSESDVKVYYNSADAGKIYLAVPKGEETFNIFVLLKVDNE